MTKNSVIGIDLGGTKIYTALASLSGDIIAEVKVPTQPALGITTVRQNIVWTVDHLTSQAGLKDRVRAVGIGVPGPLNVKEGVVYQAPNLGWREVPIRQILEEALKLPVYIENDANLAAIGENLKGAGAGVKDLIYVAVGTGIGGGLILNGQIYHGAGFGAGELGHMTIEPNGRPCNCGNKGCLETLASGNAMVQKALDLVKNGRGQSFLAAVKGEPQKISPYLIAKLAAAGDKEALSVLEAAGTALGIGLANVINLLNPSLVILGGGALKVGRPYWKAMEKEVLRRALQAAWRQVRIVPAGLGDRSGLFGAIALACQYETPDVSRQTS
ncbi:MAG: glucokinase [Peptococcaceae bacterium]